MPKLLKKIILGSLVLFLLLGSFSFAKALEVNYPSLPGIGTLTNKTTLPQYIKYIFHLSIYLVGIIAFIALIYGGFLYMTSTGNPQQISTAKDQIFSAIIGLLILLTSYLILNTINPNLTYLKGYSPSKKISLETPSIPGIHFYSDSECKTPIADYTFSQPSLSESLPYYMHVDPGYLAILHQYTDYKGVCEVISEGGCQRINEFHSIEIFKLVEKTTVPNNPEEGVATYTEKDFEGTRSPNELFFGSGELITSTSYYLYDSGSNLSADSIWNSTVNSVKIEGPYVLLLLSADGRCETIESSNEDLSDSYLGGGNFTGFWAFRVVY